MKYTVIAVFKWPSPNESVISRYGGMERGGGGPPFSWQRSKLLHFKATKARWGSSSCESGINLKKHWGRGGGFCCQKPVLNGSGAHLPPLWNRGTELRKVKEARMTFQPCNVQLSGWGWRDRRRKRIVFLVIGQAWRSVAGKGSSFRCTSPLRLDDGWIPRRYSLLTFSLRLQSSEVQYNSQQRLQPKTSISNVMKCMKWSSYTLLHRRGLIHRHARL